MKANTIKSRRKREKEDEFENSSIQSCQHTILNKVRRI